MHRLHVVGGEAFEGGGLRKHLVHSAQHIGAGTKRVPERHVLQLAFDAGAQVCEGATHGIELARRRALEREDRLLLVADGEDGPLDRAGAGTREEFAGHPPDDIPLLRACILRLIDQHVVDALVELVVHPGGAVLAEQGESPVDEVVVVEEPAPIFRRLVPGDHGVRDGDQRGGTVTAGDRFAALDQRHQPRALLLQAIDQVSVRHRPGDEALARLELVGQEHLEIGIGPQRAGRRQCARKPPCLLLVALRPQRKRRGCSFPRRSRQQRAFRDLGLDPVEGVVDVDAERPAQYGDRAVDTAAAVDPGAQPIALADGLADHLLESPVGGHGDRGRQRTAERAVRRARRVEQHAQADVVQELRFRGVVEHVEACRHVGLERKLMEQPGAEGVNGLHLESAGRLEREREQPPRLLPPVGVRHNLSHGANRIVEGRVTQRGPFAQRLEHAVRHVRGGRLGESDAEDLGRRDPVEQQPDHALGEHMRLARSGVGGHPRRHGGVRCRDLQPQHRVRDDAERVHRRLFLLRFVIKSLTKISQ